MITKERLEAKLMNAEGAAAYHLKGISSDNREFSNGSKLFREKAQEQAEILRLALAGLAVQEVERKAIEDFAAAAYKIAPDETMALKRRLSQDAVLYEFLSAIDNPGCE